MSEIAPGIGMSVIRPSSRAIQNYAGIKPNQANHIDVIEQMFRTPSSGPKRGIGLPVDGPPIGRTAAARSLRPLG